MNKKTRNIIITLYIFAIIMLLVGTTFSYFTRVNTANIAPAVEVTSAQLNHILFDTGDEIFLNPNPYNFQEGMGNLSKETFARAYLKHSGSTDKLSINYNLRLNIYENTLIYSTGEPELLLEIYDEDNNKITNVDGLEYVTVKDGDGNNISGFDITVKSGEFYLLKNKLIETNSEISEKWHILVTYVNLNKSQNANFDKIFRAEIVIEKEN